MSAFIGWSQRLCLTQDFHAGSRCGFENLLNKVQDGAEVAARSLDNRYLLGKSTNSIWIQQLIFIRMILTEIRINLSYDYC